MGTKLHWVDGPWPGKLAVAARPRGGEWLEDEIAGWHGVGIDTVLSLLTPEEEQSLDLANESNVVKARGMNFMQLPIQDREVPGSETELSAALENLNDKLLSGKNVVVHCRQGVGRSGLVAACLLITNGLDAKTAVKNISAARGIPVPETKEQRQWIDHYAAVLTSTK